MSQEVASGQASHRRTRGTSHRLFLGGTWRCPCRRTPTKDATRSWSRELLRDRQERVNQIDEVRSRLDQAFQYFARLCLPRYESERHAKERARRLRNE